MRRRPIGSTLAAPAALLAALALAPDSAVGQDRSAGAFDRATLTGRVVDAGSGRPLSSTRVRIVEEDRTALTDEEGRFVLRDVPVGAAILAFDQLGYAHLWLSLEVEPGTAALDVALEPRPIVIEGLHVMVDRLERRRRAVPMSVSVLETEELQRMPGDLLWSLQSSGLLRMAPCPASPVGISDWCIRSRGGLRPVQLWIDERRSLMGLDELRHYQTDEVHAVEVYQLGRAIRVYTRQFMERIASQPRVLRPIRSW